MSAVSKQQRVKGEAFLSEAESTLAKRTWFASAAEQKHEDAAELYCKAANAFKVGGFFLEAGDAYGKAASIYREKLKNGMEASKALTESGELGSLSCPPRTQRGGKGAVVDMCFLSFLGFG